MAGKASVMPVFLKTANIPDFESNRPTVLELCLAAERAAGSGSMVGAQELRGLWRLYPASREARTDLLIKGIFIRSTSLQVSNSNPFLIRGDTGEEKPTTKLWIDNIPISCADSEIEHTLSKLGIELRSAVKTERARDSDGKLTRFLTGRRFVFISVPLTPLDKFAKIGIFNAKLYHKEQRATEKNLACSRCLEKGHHASSCEKDIVCRACRKPGHKRGDPECSSPTEEQQSRNTQSATAAAAEKEGNDDRRGEKEDGRNRGRPQTRQTTLRPSLTLNHPRRHRSDTPSKRRRSSEMCPVEDLPGGKQARRVDSGKDSDTTDTPPVTTTDVGVWG